MRILVLLLAGIGSGLIGSIAGLASIVSYPVLLALGLPPVTANVTNTVSLVFSSIGSVSGSRPELRGQRATVRPLAIAGLLGGAVGGALLLATPGASFTYVVPWLIAIASIAILLRRRLVETPHAHTHAHLQAHAHATANVTANAEHAASVGGPVPNRALIVGMGIVGIYGGYFGAGAGVMMMALLLYFTSESMPQCNAVKNVVLGLANGVAAVSFVFFGDVRWAVIPPLGIGLLIGGRLGPIVVRRAPAGPLRLVIAVAGLGLAVKLGINAYR